MGAELVAFGRVQCPFQQGAEDGRFHMLPVRLGRADQQLDLPAIQRQHRGVLEQLAVEAQHLCGQHRREAAHVHVLPQCLNHAHGHLGLFAVALEQVAEAVFGQQAHVFDKHGEQAAHQKARNLIGRMAAGFQAAGQLGQTVGNLTGDACRFAAGVQPQRIGPDSVQALADVLTQQVAQGDAVVGRVRERHIGAAAAAEFAIELDAVANIDHHHEWRAAFGRRQGAGIGLGLATGTQQAIVKPLGVAGSLELLGLQHEGPATVQVHPPRTSAAIAMGEGDRTLEHVVLFRRGMRARHAQQFAQVDQKALRGGQLGGFHSLPAGDEFLDRASGSCIGHRGASLLCTSLIRPRAAHTEAG